MKKNNLFYKYYDTLYSSKNYADEAQYFLWAAKKFYQPQLKKILEIGAGTGNHSIALAENDFEIVAIDTDEKMIQIASQKISEKKNQNIRLYHSSVENLKKKDFDLAIAGFNVVNYIDDINSLISFFSAIQKRLRENAFLIFDCWNGIAAILDQPKSKVIKANSGDNKIICLITSNTNLMSQKTRLTYHIKVTDKKENEIEKDEFFFEHTLWTPAELHHCLNAAGFAIIKRSKHFQIHKSADETDWKIMYMCRK